MTSHAPHGLQAIHRGSTHGRRGPDAGKPGKVARLRAMDGRVYDWSRPTGVEEEIQRRLSASELPEPSAVRLEEIRSSIEQMRRDIASLATFS